jgi:hypothetical protein
LAAEKPDEASRLFMQMVPESDRKLVEESSRTLSREFMRGIPQWGYQNPQAFERYRAWAVSQKILSLKESSLHFVRHDLLPSSAEKSDGKHPGRGK